MNERIKEMIEQAGIEEWWDSGNECREVLQEHLEKLAELIVRECAEVGSKFSQAHPLDIQYQIKRHLGVE